MCTERWRDVPGYEGRYQVGSHGGVIGPSGKKLKPYPGSSRLGGDHLKVDLQGPGGERRIAYVHQLVLLAFHGSRPPGASQSRHLDGRSRNNRWWNLAWGTMEENVADKMRHEATRGAPNRVRGEVHYDARLTADKVREIRRRAAAGEEHSALGREFGVSHTAIYYIVIRRNWKHVE